MVIAVFLAGSFIVGCSSDDSVNDSDKNSNTSSTIPKTLPPLETTPTSSVPGTVVLGNTAFLSPQEISTIWIKPKICGLVSARQAQKILSMKTIPEGEYRFSPESGARCSYRSGSGDELYIEISISSFASARTLDRALNVETTPVTIEGIGGVLKSSAAFGTTYELNIGGEQSNQWVVNAPTRSSAKSLAQALIVSFG